MVIADEGVHKNASLIGRVTSGGFSYHFGHDIAMALVPTALSDVGSTLQVLVHNELRQAEVVPESPYDPSSARARM